MADALSPTGALIDASRAVYERHRPVEEVDDLWCADPDCRQPWPCEAISEAKRARQEALKD